MGYLEYVATTTDPTRPSPPPTPTPGAVQARLYQAVIRAGELSGTRVILKAYPIGVEADLLASNELRAFASLQPPSTPDYSSHLTKLLGAFQVGPPGATESWLVLRNDGLSTVDQFAVQCAKAFGEGRAVGEAQFWDRFDSTAPLRRRADIIRRILTGVLLGLEAMHDRDWLHQSLGPASVSLDTTDESRMGRFLNVRLRDLAFAVDVSKKTFVGGNTLADIWQGSGAERKPDPRDKLAEPLFVRARQEGAESPDDRRDFGKADDIFAAGLLFIYLALTPFARSDDVDMGQLQRLVEGAFRADLEGFRYAPHLAISKRRTAPAMDDVSDELSSDLMLCDTNCAGSTARRMTAGRPDAPFLTNGIRRGGNL